jgi:single-stranded DNA-binding protein
LSPFDHPSIWIEEGLMASDNQTVIVGNLVDDPELRFTNNGTPVSNLRVAVTQRVLQDGVWRDGPTSFFRVNAWRETATHLAESLHKGDRVVVLGRLRQRSWETPEGSDVRWPRSRQTRSRPASSGPPPRSSGSRPVAPESTRFGSPES